MRTLFDEFEPTALGIVQRSTGLMLREIGGHSVVQRLSDQYINATALCKAAGKRLANYTQNAATQAYVAELSAVTGISVTGLIETRQGGNNRDEQGTWVHPDVSIHLAQWLSPKFAVAVSRWVRELLTTGRVELAPSLQAGVYDIRCSKIASIRHQLPSGYWCVFVESFDLLVLAERIFRLASLPLSADDVADVSIGLHWSSNREGKVWTVPSRSYLHVYPAELDSNRANLGVEARCYHDAERGHFHSWLRAAYIPDLFPRYIVEKYGKKKSREALAMLQTEIPHTLCN